MRRVTVREAREHISELLDAAARGEEIIIERRGQPTARLVPFHRPGFESLAEFRATQRPARTDSVDVIRAERDER
jgi:prevent-host-death family protein